MHNNNNNNTGELRSKNELSRSTDLVVGFWAGEVTPFLDYTTEVYRVEWDEHCSDLIVLREPIKVEYVKHQRLGTDLCVRHLINIIDSQCYYRMICEIRSVAKWLV